MIGARNVTRWMGLAWGLLLLAAFMPGASPAGDKSLMERFAGERDAPWEITADQLSYSEKEGVYLAEGEVVIKRPGQVLSARRAKYNEKSGVVEVSGDVVLESDGDILRTEEAVFNLNTQEGKIFEGRLFLKENHYYISGDEIVKTGPDTYLVKGCRITTCDGETADWSITGSEVKVTVEGYGTVKNAVFRIRDVPAFYIPYAIFPAKTKRQSGFLPPRLGYSDRNGLDVDLPFFWAVSDQTDATFYERFMSERGLMQGLEFRYVAREESKGTLLFDVLSDRVEEKDLTLPEEANLSPFERTNEHRYYLRGRADQAFPLGVRARLDADYLSDQDYLREFQGSVLGFQGRPDLAEAYGRPVEEIQSPTRRSALRLSHDRENYSLQALGSYHQRPENPPNDETPQPVAGLNLGILPRSLPRVPLFLDLAADYDYVWRETGLKGHRGSFSPAVSYPFRLGRYLEAEPSVSYIGHRQWTDEPLDGGRDASRNGYDFQTRVSTVLERVFDTGWGNARRVKHKIVPSLVYRFRAIEDPSGPWPWFEPFEEEGKRNQVALSLDQFLDARMEDEKGNVRYGQWGVFSLSQAYDIDEAREDPEPPLERRPFEPLVGILTFNPFQNLVFDAEARWDHYDEEISFADLALQLGFDRAGGKRDIFGVDYQYSAQEGESLNFYLHVNLRYGFSVGGSVKRDLRLKENTESSAWADYESQCWGVRVVGESLSEDKSFMIYFRLLGLGDFKGL